HWYRCRQYNLPQQITLGRSKGPGGADQSRIDVLESAQSACDNLSDRKQKRDDDNRGNTKAEPQHEDRIERDQRRRIKEPEKRIEGIFHGSESSGQRAGQNANDYRRAIA